MSDSRLADAIKRVEDCRRMNTYTGGASNRDECCSGVATDDLALVLQAAKTFNMEEQARLSVRNVPNRDGDAPKLRTEACSGCGSTHWKWRARGPNSCSECPPK